MRSRNIKPEDLIDERLASCSPLARLLGMGMRCVADRDGRLEDRPMRIRAAVLPHDAIDAEPLLAELAKAGWLTRYVVNGAGYIQLTDWLKTQAPHIKEQASTIPAPDSTGACTGSAPTLPVHAPGRDRASTKLATLIPDSQSDSRESGPFGPPAAPPPSPARNSGITLKAYLERCQAEGKKPVPAGHQVRTYCQDAGITEDMLQVAWCVFRHDHTAGTYKLKRYKDWPAHFENAVRGCWARLWFTDNGEVKWSSRGMQEKTVLEARMKTKEEAGAAH